MNVVSRFVVSFLKKAKTLKLLNIKVYLETCQAPKMEHLRCLTGS